MDHSNYYANKYNNYIFGPLNYQPLYDNHYQNAPLENTNLHQPLLASNHAYDRPNDSISCSIPSAATHSQSVRTTEATSSTLAAPKAAAAVKASVGVGSTVAANDFSKYYENMYQSALIDGNDYSESSANYSSCKLFETLTGCMTTTNSAINSAANNTATNCMQSNVNYNSYHSEANGYGGAALNQKSTNQYYAQTDVSLTSRTMQSAVHSSADSHGATVQSTRQMDSKAMTKPSAIKPLNVYPATPLNYKLYGAPHASAKLVDDGSGNRGMYAAANYKAADVYYPEAIARYPNHVYSVPTSNVGATSTHYMPPASSYMTDYSHSAPTVRQQTAPSHHSRGSLQPAYQSAQLADCRSACNGAANSAYYGPSIVRPTPSNKSHVQYSNAYSYAPTRQSVAAAAKHHASSAKASGADLSHYPLAEPADRSYAKPVAPAPYNAGFIDLTAEPYTSSKPPPKYSSCEKTATYGGVAAAKPVAQAAPVQQASAPVYGSAFDTPKQPTNYPLVPNPIYGGEYYQPQASAKAYSNLQPAYPQPYAAAKSCSVAPADSHPVNNAYYHYYGGKPMVPAQKYPYIDIEDKINSSMIVKNRSLQQYPADYRALNYSTLPKSVYDGAAAKADCRGSALNTKNQYIYNYNAYNHCYQEQPRPMPAHLNSKQGWLPSVGCPRISSVATTAEQLKKQNLREFISSWNEDEEEENESSAPNVEPKTAGTDDPYSMKKAAAAAAAAKDLSTQPYLPHESVAAPKIHVGITVDNGGSSAHNLPDIIIDIEKPKLNGDGECFDRSAAPQNLSATASEKLYIMDAVDVPLADLSKYRHLSVVNKLPENIVLSSDAESGVSESLKFIEEVETNHARFFKNDFEMNVEYDDDGNCTLDTKNIVECKNITAVQKVKKIIRKYRKQREQMRKPKIMAFKKRLIAESVANERANSERRSMQRKLPSCLTPPVDLSATSRVFSPERIDCTDAAADCIFSEFAGSPASLSSIDSILSLSNEYLAEIPVEPLDAPTGKGDADDFGSEQCASSTKTLRQLSREAVIRNQINMSNNLKAYNLSHSANEPLSEAAPGSKSLQQLCESRIEHLNQIYSLERMCSASAGRGI